MILKTHLYISRKQTASPKLKLKKIRNELVAGNTLFFSQGSSYKEYLRFELSNKGAFFHVIEMVENMIGQSHGQISLLTYKAQPQVASFELCLQL